MASAVANCNLLGAFSRLSLSYAPPQKSASYEVERGSGNLSFPAKQSFHGIIEAAHKKGAGSTKNGRDSIGKRLGVKIFGNQAAKPGSIIIRQRGTKFHPGNNVGLGKDYTIYSLIDGLVQFEKFGPDKKKKVSVYPRTEEVKEKVLDPNSWRAQRIEYFRLRREKRKLRKAGLWPPALVLASAQSNVSGQAEAIG